MTEKPDKIDGSLAPITKKTKACINCTFLKIGWYHPICNNHKSSMFKQNVRDMDKCNKFNNKYVVIKVEDDAEI